MADLKPCPFCGGEAMICTTGDEDGWYSVACKRIWGCGAKFEWFDREEEAIEAWNTRKPMEAVVAELEKQVEQYDRRAEEHKDYEDYHARYWAKKCSYEHALEIVRGKE